MDPVSFSIGVISLAGLVSTIIEGFAIFRGMRAFGRDQEILCLMLDIEKYLFLQWVHRANELGILSEPCRGRELDWRHERESNLVGRRTREWDDGRRMRGAGDLHTKAVIGRVLHEIHTLLTHVSDLQSKYGLAKVAVEGGTEFRTDRVSQYQLRWHDHETGRRREELATRQKERDGPSMRRKFVWTINDRYEFRELIEELGYFVGKLDQMLPANALPSSREYRRTIRDDLRKVWEDDAHTLRLIEAAADEGGRHEDWSDIASQLAGETETAASTNGSSDSGWRSKRGGGSGRSRIGESDGGRSGKRERRSRLRVERQCYNSDFVPVPARRSRSGRTLVDMMGDVVRSSARPISTFWRPPDWR